MDILYIYKNGYSKCNGLELKMSIRSIEKYGKNVGRIFVTDKIEWANKNLIQVKTSKYTFKTRTQESKHIDMIKSLLYIVDNTDISDEFLISMDDHFYVNPVDFDKYPYYCKLFNGANTLPNHGNNVYQRFLVKCKNELKKQNLSCYYFTLYRNIHCSKKIIKECRHYLEKVIKERIACEPFNYLLNYQYSKYGFNFITTNDIKFANINEFNKYDLKQTNVFSTYDFNTTDELYNKLLELYPNKSKYEI